MSGPTAMIWINGTRQDDDGVHVSARDRGLTLADGVFETMRARSGTIFRFDRHLTRLQHALAVLDIPAPDRLPAWVGEALRAFGPADASVRLTVTRGVAATGGLAPPSGITPTVIVAVSPMPVFPPRVYDAGLRAQIAAGRRNERAQTAGLKTLAYTDAIAAFISAQRGGADEALFLDTEDHCSEATSSNLFVWTGDVLLTPPASCAALPGITRATVLELAATLGLVAEERVITVDQLLAAEEAFLTSSLRGVAPLVAIDEAAIGAGIPGPVTRRIAAAYAALVAEHCGAASTARA